MQKKLLLILTFFHLFSSDQANTSSISSEYVQLIEAKERLIGQEARQRVVLHLFRILALKKKHPEQLCFNSDSKITDLAMVGNSKLAYVTKSDKGQRLVIRDLEKDLNLKDFDLGENEFFGLRVSQDETFISLILKKEEFICMGPKAKFFNINEGAIFDISLDNIVRVELVEKNKVLLFRKKFPPYMDGYRVVDSANYFKMGVYDLKSKECLREYVLPIYFYYSLALDDKNLIFLSDLTRLHFMTKMDLDTGVMSDIDLEKFCGGYYCKLVKIDDNKIAFCYYNHLNVFDFSTDSKILEIYHDGIRFWDSDLQNLNSQIIVYKSKGKLVLFDVQTDKSALSVKDRVVEFDIKDKHSNLIVEYKGNKVSFQGDKSTNVYCINLEDLELSAIKDFAYQHLKEKEDYTQSIDGTNFKLTPDGLEKLQEHLSKNKNTSDSCTIL